MRYFVDCEFLEAGPTSPIHLVSIGIKCEDGREFYAEDSGCPLDQASEWVVRNVVPQLKRHLARPREIIRKELVRFVGPETPTWWGYYADYDWVVLAQLFGNMVDLPENWPKYCLDLKQVWRMLGGVVKLPAQTSVEHHALNDAIWNFEAWKVLNSRWSEVYPGNLP